MNTIFITDTWYNGLLTHYGKSSIKTLEYGIKRIYRELYGLDQFIGIDPVIKKIDMTLKWIDQHENIKVKQNLIKTVLAFLRYPPRNVKIPRDVIKQYQKYADSIVNESLDKVNQFGDKVSENWLDWPKVVKILNNSDNKLLALLYTQIPPLNIQEYLDTVIVNLPKIPNYDHVLKVLGKNLFDVGNGKLVIRYQMTNIYGDRIIDIPRKVIREILKIRGGINRVLLPLEDSEISDIFWPRRIGTSMLRKIYIKWHLGKLSLEKRKKLAYIMGHSLEAQQVIFESF